MSMELVSLEELVLLSMEAFGGQGRVTSIRYDLERCGVVVTGGAVDRTLRRLEAKGMVSSFLDTGKNADGSIRYRGAGVVRHFALTELGVSALKHAEQTRQALRSIS